MLEQNLRSWCESTFPKDNNVVHVPVMTEIGAVRLHKMDQDSRIKRIQFVLREEKSAQCSAS